MLRRSPDAYRNYGSIWYSFLNFISCPASQPLTSHLGKIMWKHMVSWTGFPGKRLSRRIACSRFAGVALQSCPRLKQGTWVFVSLHQPIINRETLWERGHSLSQSSFLQPRAVLSGGCRCELSEADAQPLRMRTFSMKTGSGRASEQSLYMVSQEGQ